MEQLQQMLNLGDEQTSLMPSMLNTQDDISRTSSEENQRAFLPISPKIGGQVNNNRPNIGQYLTREQTNYVYRIWRSK